MITFRQVAGIKLLNETSVLKCISRNFRGNNWTLWLGVAQQQIPQCGPKIRRPRKIVVLFVAVQLCAEIKQSNNITESLEIMATMSDSTSDTSNNNFYTETQIILRCRSCSSNKYTHCLLSGPQCQESSIPVKHALMLIMIKRRKKTIITRTYPVVKH